MVHKIAGSVAQDKEKIVQIGSKVEVAVNEIVETKSVVEDMAVSISHDKKKITRIGGVLEGAVNEFSQTNGVLK